MDPGFDRCGLGSGKLDSSLLQRISVPAQDISAIRNALQNAWQGIDLKASERIEADPAVESYSSKHSAEMVARIFDGLLLSRGG
jgi:hypothetical protein